MKEKYSKHLRRFNSTLSVLLLIATTVGRVQNKKHMPAVNWKPISSGLRRKLLRADYPGHLMRASGTHQWNWFFVALPNSEMMFVKGLSLSPSMLSTFVHASYKYFSFHSTVEVFSGNLNVLIWFRTFSYSENIFDY